MAERELNQEAVGLSPGQRSRSSFRELLSVREATTSVSWWTVLVLLAFFVVFGDNEASNSFQWLLLSVNLH